MLSHFWEMHTSFFFIYITSKNPFPLAAII